MPSYCAPVNTVVPVPGGVHGLASALLAQAPVSGGLGRHHSLGVGRLRLGVLFSFFPRGLFEQSRDFLDDARLRIHLQPSRPRRPSRVPSKQMLLRRRDVSTRAVRQADIESKRQWAGCLQL